MRRTSQSPDEVRLSSLTKGNLSGKKLKDLRDKLDNVRRKNPPDRSPPRGQKLSPGRTLPSKKKLNQDLLIIDNEDYAPVSRLRLIKPINEDAWDISVKPMVNISPQSDEQKKQSLKTKAKPTEQPRKRHLTKSPEASKKQLVDLEELNKKEMILQKSIKSLSKKYNDLKVKMKSSKKLKSNVSPQHAREDEQDEIEKSLKQIDQLLKNISHKIKGPVGRKEPLAKKK